MSASRPVERDTMAVSRKPPGPFAAGWVRLADRVVAITAVREHTERYTSLFSRARSEVGYAVCLCRSDHVVRMVIRCRAGKFHLANWPAGGHQHAGGCPWFRSPASESGRSSVAEAIRSDDDGTSIRLAMPLIVRDASAAPAEPPSEVPEDTGSVTVRRAVGLLSVLHLLWESAQLNVCNVHAGNRSWRDCRALLAEQVADCRINRLELGTLLWIVPAFEREHAEQINIAWKRFLSRLLRVGRVQRRCLVLGEIRTIEPTVYGVRVRLAHQRAALFASKGLMDRVHRSYPSVFSEHAGKTGRRQVVLCLVELSRHGHPIIVALAAMLTTASYLPVDSEYEAQMADGLTAAGRAFYKPLHYDGGEVFPDFILSDVDPVVHVEVWGVRGRQGYEDRKRAKKSFYLKAGRSLLEWDVDQPLPELARR
ncbi:DUF1173 family protein [Pseudonocardiaceae bacterium YIM PH 21723]|nr:DUF1173 family protein [Pseudonocardiaceae bacterium YIM PH 21723]